MSRSRARALIRQYGWNTTCYQILNPGMELWFAPEGDAVVGFVERAGYRVVAGAPVCSHDRFAEVAAGFAADAWRQGRRVCYFAAEEWFEAEIQKNGRHARISLGAMPVWAPQQWAGRLAANANVRAQLNRARNKQVSIDEWSAQQVQACAGLHQILDEWLASRGLPPMRFVLEADVLDRLGDRRVFVAESPAGLQGFLIASPVPARNGWLAELVVRRPSAPNGTAEMLIDAAVTRLGGDYFTLGLAPLARMKGAEPNPLWLGLLLGWMQAHGRRFYNFRGLEYFKSKFDPPDWKPVYALMPGPAVTVPALYAIAAAFAGGPPFALLGRGLVAAIGAEGRRLFHSR